VVSTITATTSTKAISVTSNALHARTSTSNTCRVTHRDDFDREAERVRPMDSIHHWHIQELDENEEEFVSVEKVEDTYFIKTSLHPLRPNRGIRRSNHSTDFNGTTETDNYKISKKDRERRGDTKTDHLAKFTYFLNPSSRVDLMNYKMSRKDKKHSETYYERVKRKQKNLEASITTITTMSHYNKSVEDAKNYTDTSLMEDKSAEEWAKQKILKFASLKKDSILLQKIREKRKKRLAPKSSTKKRTSRRETFNGNLAENEITNIKREDEKSFLKISSLGNDNYLIQEKSNKDTDLTERKQSAIKCDQTKQNCPGRDNNYLDKKNNISKNIDDEQENNRGGFKGIFANSYRVEAENMEDKIGCERISEFDRQSNERLKRYKMSLKSDCKSYDKNDESSFFREEGSSFDNIKKSNPKDANRDKLLSTNKREEFISVSFDDIRNRNVKSSVFEKTKTLKKTDVRDETKDARREDVHLDNLDGNEISVIKRKLALPISEIQLNQEKEKIMLEGRLLNTGVKHKRQPFKSLSSSHCNDLAFNPEFGMLKPNVSFLHTYQKTRSHKDISC